MPRDLTESMTAFVSERGITRPPQGLIRRVAERVIVFDPKPLAEPRVDPHLLSLPLMARVLEVMRYNLARLEFSLAPDGWAREWILSSGRVLIFVVCPLVALLVLLAVLVPIFGSLDSIATSIESTARGLFFATLWTAGILIVIPLALGLVGVLWRRKTHAIEHHEREYEPRQHYPR